MSWFSLHKAYTATIVIIITLGLTSGILHASEPTNGHESSESAKFDPGSFVMDHIGDSHDWHILTVGHSHISLPLPIILISKEQGLKVFMSSKFHHGHDSYSNFTLMLDGENKGKIVETLSNGTQVLPLDFSITKNVLAIFFSLGLLLWLFISIANSYKQREGKEPKGLQSFLEPLIIFIRDDVAKTSIGEKKYEKYVPYLLTTFFFIFLNNLLGLVPILPGGANVTGNIAVTLVLALITFIITLVSGNKVYYSHVFWPDVPHGLKILMIPIEIIGVFIKPFVLMVRLFANITAGHIIVLSFFSLIFIFGNLHIVAGYGMSVLSVAFTIFMTLLELLVAFIQAYVFTLLSALYFGMAVEEHH